MYQRNKGLWVTRAKHHLSLSSTPLISFSALILICLFLCEAQIKVPDSVCVCVCVFERTLGEYVLGKGCVCGFSMLLFSSCSIFFFTLFCPCSVLLFFFVSLIVLLSYVIFFLQSFLIQLWKYELLISPFLVWFSLPLLVFVPPSILFCFALDYIISSLKSQAVIKRLILVSSTLLQFDYSFFYFSKSGLKELGCVHV